MLLSMCLLSMCLHMQPKRPNQVISPPEDATILEKLPLAKCNGGSAQTPKRPTGTQPAEDAETHNALLGFSSTKRPSGWEYLGMISRPWPNRRDLAVKLIVLHQGLSGQDC